MDTVFSPRKEGSISSFSISSVCYGTGRLLGLKSNFHICPDLSEEGYTLIPSNFAHLLFSRLKFSRS